MRVARRARGHTHALVSVAVKVAERATLALIPIVVACGVESAALTDSGAPALNAEPDPLTRTCLNLDAGAVIATIGVTRAAQAPVIDRLIPIAELIGAAAQVVPARADLLVTDQVPVADRIGLASFETQSVSSRRATGEGPAAGLIALTRAKWTHATLTCVADARGPLTLAVTHGALAVAVTAYAEPTRAATLRLLARFAGGAFAVRGARGAARARRLLLLRDAAPASAGLPLSAVAVGAAALIAGVGRKAPAAATDLTLGALTVHPAAGGVRNAAPLITDLTGAAVSVGATALLRWHTGAVLTARSGAAVAVTNTRTGSTTLRNALALKARAPTGAVLA